MPEHTDLEPQPADVGAHQHVLFGLGNDDGVGLVAAQQRRQRAVAGAFLFDDRLEVDGRGGRVTGGAHRVVGIQVGGQAGFHVGGAAAIHPAVDDRRIPR
ncbi:hypothetical protein G6F31_021014 [Rhizopus arrhizus]|nr:hypothetical protein G6F31_021014 [Rhizopus arrhizus]